MATDSSLGGRLEQLARRVGPRGVALGFVAGGAVFYATKSLAAATAAAVAVAAFVASRMSKSLGDNKSRFTTGRPNDDASGTIRGADRLGEKEFDADVSPPADAGCASCPAAKRQGRDGPSRRESFCPVPGGATPYAVAAPQEPDTGTPLEGTGYEGEPDLYAGDTSGPTRLNDPNLAGGAQKQHSWPGANYDFTNYPGAISTVGYAEDTSGGPYFRGGPVTDDAAGGAGFLGVDGAYASDVPDAPDTVDVGADDAWNYGHEDNIDGPAQSEGNPFSLRRTSAPKAAAACGDDQADDYSYDVDERNTYQARARNDATRVTVGTMQRRKVLDPYLREEVEQAEDREWWGRQEV